MSIRKSAACLSLVALLGTTTLSVFADDSSVTVDAPGVGLHDIKKGDKVPDQYKRKELAVGDWKKHKLAMPTEDQQWVKIQDKYLLVNIPNGTVKDVVPARGK
ncbi:RcnB family protein [Pseudomonas sp. dw_358]|uniref:RcnB family protein n=1 Tax=Pseudomonas sp. dw_358 TaxID=2720083 RepID=UPI001BD52194|nr:RcnB family protein [Pseudomonas sp. dw_358]